jgi:hypothetical protein
MLTLHGFSVYSKITLPVFFGNRVKCKAVVSRKERGGWLAESEGILHKRNGGSGIPTCGSHFSMFLNPLAML